MATTAAPAAKKTATLPTDVDAAALQIGANVNDAQSNLMKAYSLKDGAGKRGALTNLFSDSKLSHQILGDDSAEDRFAVLRIWLARK